MRCPLLNVFRRHYNQAAVASMCWQHGKNVCIVRDYLPFPDLRHASLLKSAATHEYTTTRYSKFQNF